ncbi:MAG: TrpR-related protein YerC/YecD [Clostridia bacterium]|nr:TrpR-related protein YerC/YecD [Clostridia bacterium]
MKNDKQLLNELYEALLNVDNKKEMALFLDDLCTIKELESMAQRLKAAKMLLEDKTYNEIVEETEISSATLARVSKCVRYGKGGYKKIITKLDK